MTDAIPAPTSLRDARPAARIALAIALSLLIHAALLFGPNLIELKPAETLLPPLVARLEPLPAVKPATKPHPRKHAPVKHPHLTPPPIAISTPDAVAEETTPQAEPAAAPIAETTEPAAPSAEDAAPAHPLPRQAQLTFHVYKGADFAVGQARHHLEIKDDNSYTLTVDMSTIGLASLFKTFEMNQQSSGTVSTQGLRPDEFSEGRTNDDKKQKLTARFDWQNKLLLFSGGNQSVLPEQAQDMVSFLYQLSQLPLNQPVIPIYISNGKKLEKYQLEVGKEEDILTRKGKMRALPLHKIHAPGEEGLDIWLGLEYRLLPIKIRQTDRKGEIAGQMIISDIRVSEE